MPSTHCSEMLTLLLRLSLGVIVMTADVARADFLVTSALTDEVLRFTDNGGARGAFVSAGSGGLNAPLSATWDPAGNLFVGTADGRIFVYDGSSGAFERSMTLATFPQCWGLLFTPQKDLLVSNSAGHVVYRVNPDTGAITATIGQGVLNQPLKMLTAPDGRVLVSDDSSQHNIYTIDLASNTVAGVFATTTGFPFGIDYGPDGNLYAAVRTNPTDHSIYRFDGRSGAPLGRFTVVDNVTLPSDILFTPNGKLFAGEEVGGTLTRFNAVTGEQEFQTTAGAVNGELLYVPEPTGTVFGGVAIGMMLSRRGARSWRTGASWSSASTVACRC